MVKGEHTNSYKLKLFGFELDPCKPDEINQKTPHENDQESPANSSSDSTVSSQKEEQQPSKEVKIQQIAAEEEEKGKNFVCQYCYKRFANSQALGGHQNAHKKERMRKKRLQLQARTASINYYLQQPFPNEQVYIHEYPNSDFTVISDESSQSHHQISFTSSSSSYGGHDLVNGNNRWFSHGYGYGPIQQNPCKFSLTHVEKSNQSK